MDRLRKDRPVCDKLRYTIMFIHDFILATRGTGSTYGLRYSNEAWTTWRAYIARLPDDTWDTLALTWRKKWKFDPNP